ncbi:phosphatidylinositol N-acetylglucosaminyltransferase subunit Q-like [Paramacrobiotus metropolitanus]|uniref:phosphatidylinositol N-acetylglucosaminyltransferase subunit Q-like n=1 Tax=Paramacrobiotus metropolitanus TaxID=2943436 RepID=UPI002445ED1E|nr:phosphatidylinositol N-acetylglucosaminyltransferase subunit Q-like [Paramacrobiotus metropolitanus]
MDDIAPSVTPRRCRMSEMARFSEVLRLFKSRAAFLSHLRTLFFEERGGSGRYRYLAVAVFLLIADIGLGGLLVSFVLGKDQQICHNVSVRCLAILRNSTFSLSGVLDWLMGNPVGLKLNKELAATLGTFFKHHISLWQMYINALTSIWEDCGYFVCSAGLMGVSVQMALLTDIIALFTIHIHCFYIYMGRLYNMQLRGLLALGRLFRGKKWNPLRERVDHIPRSVDQLFVGSMLLTIMLFLLPTVLTFYVVFATLHVAVKVLQIPVILVSRWLEFCFRFG